jgi:hypothetical protein
MNGDTPERYTVGELLETPRAHLPFLVSLFPDHRAGDYVAGGIQSLRSVCPGAFQQGVRTRAAVFSLESGKCGFALKHWPARLE